MDVSHQGHHPRALHLPCLSDSLFPFWIHRNCTLIDLIMLSILTVPLLEYSSPFIVVHTVFGAGPYFKPHSLFFSSLPPCTHTICHSWVYLVSWKCHLSFRADGFRWFLLELNAREGTACCAAMGVWQCPAMWNPCPTHQGCQRGHFAMSPCLLLATSSDRGNVQRIQTIRSWVCDPNCRLNAWMFGCLGGALPPKCFLAMHVGLRIYIRNISNIIIYVLKCILLKYAFISVVTAHICHTK